MSVMMTGNPETNPVLPEEVGIVPEYYYFELRAERDAEVQENRVVNVEQDELLYELLSPDGIHFWYCHARNRKVKRILVENPQPFVHIYFGIHSSSIYRTGEAEAPFASMGNYEYNAVYFPAQASTVEWQPNDFTEVFELNVVPELLERYLPEGHPFLNAIRNGQGKATVSFSEQNLPLTPQITTLLFDMLNCPLEKHYKRLYLKGKLIELLAMLMYQHEQLGAAYAWHGLRQSELKKMQEARQLLHNNLQNPCSLIDLAHQVGTNENYLKKHFKLVFGNTVYGYIHEMRMQQARVMILQQHKEIREVATISGYKHVNHFVAAFKKFFGYSPLKLKLWLCSPLQFFFQFQSLFEGDFFIV